jgi:hypothetical protein
VEIALHRQLRPHERLCSSVKEDGIRPSFRRNWPVTDRPEEGRHPWGGSVGVSLAMSEATIRWTRLRRPGAFVPMVVKM